MKVEFASIVGLPVKTARDLMRHLNVSPISVEAVFDFLNDEHWRKTVDAARRVNPQIPVSIRQRVAEKEMCRIWRFKFTPIKVAEAEQVFAELLTEGYLEPNEPENTRDPAKYQTSMKGRRLAAASLTKRFDRARADNEVAALIARANEINTRDELVFYVNRIIAFGSYLTDCSDLGDVDLVVELEHRRKTHVEELRYRADNTGKSLSFLSRLCYGETEVMQLLRARKRCLSFSRSSALELDTKFRVLFEWTPDATRRADMEAFDWRLNEPLRQVNEWLVLNSGLNTDPIEIARWCQAVAAMLSEGANWHSKLFHDWSDNAAHELLPYWGVTASQAAAEIAHRMLWGRYCKSISQHISNDFDKPLNAGIEAEIYSHFARGTDDVDAAILIAGHFRWKLVRAHDEWYRI